MPSARPRQAAVNTVRRARRRRPALVRYSRWMDADETLRLDYEQTTQLMRALTGIRFKLLAFVPTIAGASVGRVGRGGSASDLVAVGLLGLAATFGVLLYELRNSQVYHA